MPVIEAGDAISTQQWDTDARVYTRLEHGEIVEQRPFTDAENASVDQVAAEAGRRATQVALLVQARTDLATNQAYLDAAAAGTATTDDAVAQVAALTRQAQGFIRLTVGGAFLDETGG